MKALAVAMAAGLLVVGAWACAVTRPAPSWEAANPIAAIETPPLGVNHTFSELKDPPTPARVRLGRWLFYDTRLSADSTVSCATCHRPEYGFSEPSPVSTGIRGQKGTRKAPSISNQTWTLYPNFFWDGRAASLEEQALGPVANPIEMGNTHEAMLKTIAGIRGYAPYFVEAFGSAEVTKERVAKAIADYERVCLTGNSRWDRWKMNGDSEAVSDEVKAGDALFFGKASCNQCHLGYNLTDTTFHNVGIGWNPATQTFADEGRYAVTKREQDRGAFKTPGLRDVALHAPYMHDGSVPSLRAAVEHYNKGGIPNPMLDPKMKKLDLTEREVDAIEQFLESLTGEFPREKSPAAFPQ